MICGISPLLVFNLASFWSSLNAMKLVPLLSACNNDRLQKNSDEGLTVSAMFLFG